MKTVYYPDTAIFADDDKTVISVRVEEIYEKGNALFDRTIVIEPSPVFDEFIKQVSLEKVEENTVADRQARVDAHEAWVKQSADLVMKEVEKQQKRLKTNIIATDKPQAASFDPNNISTEDLFKLKLQSFEIEEVKTSKNRELKAKIRKANSFMEVLAFTSATIQDTLSSDD